MENINLNNFNNLETVDLNKSSTGGGIGLEFLMNTSKKDKKTNKPTNIDLNDISDLENELNELTGNKGMSVNNNDYNNIAEEFTLLDNDNQTPDNEFSLPKKSSTWDGYTSKVEEIPRESVIKLTERQKRVKKMMMLQKIEDWSKKGLIELVGNSHYTMDSSFEDIEDEYENALDNKRKKDSIKLQSNVLIGCVGFIETANKWLNPFDVDLDGFQEKVTDELTDYDDIFAELFEKYKGGKLAPEVQLILKLGLTSATIAFTNKIFGGNPDFNNLLKTNPNIVNVIQQEMVNTLNKKPSTTVPSSVSSYLGGSPPPPIETKITKEPINQQSPPFANRPDLSMATGTVFREQGIDLETNYQSINNSQQRPEMRGPQSSQVLNILSGLKNQSSTQIQNNPNSMTPNYNMTQQSRPSQSIIEQTSHTQFPQQQSSIIKSSQKMIDEQPYILKLKDEFKELKELKMDNFDELSASSFNISKEDNSDNISILSNDESFVKTKSKKNRKSKQQSEKNRISMDI